MRTLDSLRAVALAGTLGLVAGCSGAPPPSEDVASSSSAITTSTILSRADQWVQAQLLYCQSPNGASDTIDPSCPSVCNRESNSAWDPYRSDCSGFVSWAWGLAAPGNTTEGFAPADTSVSYVIQGSDLQPGDALNIPGDHIVLFVSWVTVGSEANFYEEPGCSATPNYAHAFTSAVTISGSNVTIAYEGSTFTSIRFTGVTGGGDAGTVVTGGGDAGDGIGTPCTVTSTGESGVCMDTATCAAMTGGVSTAGYCPGPNNVECCTGVVTTTGSDAGAGGGDAGAPQGSGSGTSEGSGPGTSGFDAGTPEGSGMGTSTTDAGVGLGAPGGAILDGSAPGNPASSATDAGGSSGLGSFGPGPAGGCSMTSSGRSPGNGAWLFGLGAIGLGFSARRRRR
jgi:MYXO-CTERM domain-containing protein